MTVVFHLLAGLVYALVFRRDGLDIGPSTRDYGIWVREIREGEVVLAADQPRQNLGHPGILGMHWEGGYARVGEVVRADEVGVTRTLLHLEGIEPPLCREGPGPDCPQVDLESFAFPRDPTDRGLPFSVVRFDTALGRLGGWLVPGGDGRRWAIHLHGWKAERREAIRVLPSFHQAGFTSLVADYRNDPDSPRDPSGRYRFGITEWEDVDSAVQHAIAEGAEQIVLMGYSTGAALAMMFLEESKHADKIVGLVLDSPNIILADVVRWNTRDAKFPPLGLKMTQLMKETGMWIADLLWNIDWERTNYVQRAGTTLTMPTLVFHGTSDQRVPIAVSRQLEVQAPRVVELIEIPAAGHVMGWNADPDYYEGSLRGFLGRL